MDIFSTRIATRVAAVSLLAGTLALGGASSASAGVTSCPASGGKQEAGAAIGAVVGGLIGHSVGGRHATGETVAGAAVGAAAGSAIGCEAQKSDAAKRGGVYVRDGYRLRTDVVPARYDRLGATFVAVTGVNLRSAPTTRSDRVGRLRARERFQAMAYVRGTDWLLVGRNGVGVGYVRADFVRPLDRRYAAH